jgi:hypothetical protein
MTAYSNNAEIINNVACNGCNTNKINAQPPKIAAVANNDADVPKMLPPTETIGIEDKIPISFTPFFNLKQHMKKINIKEHNIYIFLTSRNGVIIF